MDLSNHSSTKPSSSSATNKKSDSDSIGSEIPSNSDSTFPDKPTIKFNPRILEKSPFHKRENITQEEIDKAAAPIFLILKSSTEDPSSRIRDIHQMILRHVWNPIDGPIPKALPISNEEIHPHPGTQPFFAAALDENGQTLLHVAIDRGFRKIFLAFLMLGAHTSVCDNNGWSIFSQSLLFNDYKIVHSLVLRWHINAQRNWNSRLPVLFRALRRLPDFEITLKWNFSCWIPFMTSFTPSDTYVLTKIGSTFRLDTTIIGFHKLRWRRGRLSLYFNPYNSPALHPGDLLLVNHDYKVWGSLYESFITGPSSQDIAFLMDRDDISIYFSGENASIEEKKGWFGWSAGTATNAGYVGSPYTISGISLAASIRKFHDRDEKRQSEESATKSTLNILTKVQTGKVSTDEASTTLSETLVSQSENETDHTLTTTNSNTNTNEDHVECIEEPKRETSVRPFIYNQDQLECIAKPKRETNVRDFKVSHHSHDISCSLWLCDNFPISFHDCLHVLDALVPISKHFKTVVDLLHVLDLVSPQKGNQKNDTQNQNQKSKSTDNQNQEQGEDSSSSTANPEHNGKGFPIKAEVPLFATLKLHIDFTSVKILENHSPKEIFIPTDYRKKPWKKFFSERTDLQKSERAPTSSTDSNSNSKASATTSTSN